MLKLGINVNEIELTVDIDFGDEIKEDIRTIKKITFADKNRYQHLERMVENIYDELNLLQIRFQNILKDEGITEDKDLKELEVKLVNKEHELADWVTDIINKVLVKYIPKDLFPKLEHMEATTIMAIWNVLLYGEPATLQDDPNMQIYNDEAQEIKKKKKKKKKKELK